MASLFEALPSDVLQSIALHTATSSLPCSGVLRGILSLLLTSSTLYRTLCMESCPHLYADIFRMTFDTDAILRRLSSQVTDSALASDLVSRCQMLRRMRRRSLASPGLRDDLLTAFWMIQESDGRNEFYLRDVCLPECLLDLLSYWDDNGKDHTHEIRSLVIWLLCCTLTQQHIRSLTPETKGILQTYLLSFTRSDYRHAPSTINSPAILSRVLPRDQTNGANATLGGLTHFIHHQSFHIQHHWKHGIEPIVRYGREWVPTCPDPTPAAINLLFCLKEIDPISIPEHLPETRSIALATQRSGATKEDIRKIRGYRTKLFADTLPSDCHLPVTIQGRGSRSEGHDLDFMMMMLGEGGIREIQTPSNLLGLMTGVWEGFYMIPGITPPIPGTIGHERQHHAPPDFICRKPLQSVFTEFVCFADRNPKTSVADDTLGVRNLPKLSPNTEAGFELDGHEYERLTIDADPRRQDPRELGTREPVDIVLLGETLEDHDQAWGGFRFAGRIRKDGSIILKREAKDDGDDAFSGTWIFEGNVRFGTVFVGTCSPSTSNMNHSSAMRGIFSMQKRVKGFTSW